MPYRNLKSIFLGPDSELPYIEADDQKSYLHLFGVKMDKYLQDLKSCRKSSFSAITKDYAIDNVAFFAEGLKESLSQFLNGYPSEAYFTFKQLIQNPNITADLHSGRLRRIAPKNDFFRIKKEYEAMKPVANGFINAKEPLDLFHVPFEKRRAIGTNRFSIPGFPCIYMSGAVSTSWSECLNNDDEAFHAIRYQNQRPMYIVDLLPLNIVLEENGGNLPLQMTQFMNEAEVFTNYALVFPLICACHSKITYIPQYLGEIQFKSEYIIPQLLLQWYREQKIPVDGLRYLSCTAKAKFGTSAFNKANYVLPVTESLETGYCRELTIIFSSTPVYTYQLKPAATTFETTLQSIQKALQAASVAPLV